MNNFMTSKVVLLKKFFKQLFCRHKSFIVTKEGKMININLCLICSKEFCRVKEGYYEQYDKK